MKRTMQKSLAILSLSTMMTGAAYAATNETLQEAIVLLTCTSFYNSVSVQVNGGAIPRAVFLLFEPMLPLRAVTESLGFTLTWNQETLSVDLMKGNVFTTVKTGEDRYAINKMLTTLGTAPELVDNKLYVPASFISKVLHGSVTTEGASVSIAMKKELRKFKRLV